MWVEQHSVRLERDLISLLNWTVQSICSIQRNNCLHLAVFTLDPDFFQPRL